MAGTALPPSFVQMPWAVLEEACLSIRRRWLRPLAQAISLMLATFETGFGGSFFLGDPQTAKIVFNVFDPSES